MPGALQITDAPPTQIGPFRGPRTTIDTMRALCLGERGERSMVVRGATEYAIRRLQPKDYLSEMLAVRHFVAERVRYANDPAALELVKDPQRLIEEIQKHGVAIGDCFPTGTLLLAEGHRLTPIEAIETGTRIWGLDRWVRVDAKAFKGRLSVDAIRLNNGSTLTLTPDHHVYVLTCPRHSLPNPAETSRRPCHCPVSERREERIRVSELRDGMVLPTPDRLPYGSEESDPDRSYVEGLYLSDGWHEPSRFGISGQDGCPKESQKREVQEICERLGIETSWARKYIRVNDSEWAAKLELMGTHAPEKHLPSLDLSEANAVATLRGIMADSGRNTNGQGTTFTTTSRRLATQVRLLHKMVGRTCNASYIENHGGFGENPIWRLGIRGPRRDEKQEKLLRVRSIERAVYEVPCWDIQTEDHRVYLPEHDVTVSQCDDIALLIATMLRQLGREAQWVTVGFGEPNHFSHVFCRGKEPKSGRWIVMDPVAGTREAQMLARVTTWHAWAID